MTLFRISLPNDDGSGAFDIATHQLGNAYRFVPFKVDADVWRLGDPRAPRLVGLARGAAQMLGEDIRYRRRQK
jgi:hypothetical protein